MVERKSIERIMIVDDDEEDREFFAFSLNLSHPDIELMEGIDGEHALKVLKETSELPACILLDLNMPRVNGLQFLKAIKKIDRLKDIPVIIYTTSKLPYDHEKTAKLGAIDFVSKPDNLDDMHQTILHVLSRGWEVGIAH